MSKLISFRIIVPKNIFCKCLLFPRKFIGYIFIILTPFGYGVKIIPKIIELYFNSNKFNDFISFYQVKPYIHSNLSMFAGLYWNLLKNFIQDYIKIFYTEMDFRGMGYKGVLLIRSKISYIYAKHVNRVGSDWNWVINHSTVYRKQIFHMHIGYTDPIFYEVPELFTIKVPLNIINKQKRFLLFGLCRQKVFEIMHYLKRFKALDIYNGKGLFLSNEVLKLKEGKQQKK